MEGYNPYASCTLTSCNKGTKSWIPPPMVSPKRFPLVDAYLITEDPCHPPGRCFPCSEPVPKFRLHRKFGPCDKCTMDHVQKEKEISQKKEYNEQWRQYYQQFSPHPTLDIELVNPNQPVEFQMELPKQGHYKELKCKTNMLAGFFNLDDNKTAEELYKEYYDPNWINCNPTLPLYECRGVINYPGLRWVSYA